MAQNCKSIFASLCPIFSAPKTCIFCKVPNCTTLCTINSTFSPELSKVSSIYSKRRGCRGTYSSFFAINTFDTSCGSDGRGSNQMHFCLKAQLLLYIVKIFSKPGPGRQSKANRRKELTCCQHSSSELTKTTVYKLNSLIGQAEPRVTIQKGYHSIFELFGVLLIETCSCQRHYGNWY